MRTGRAVDLLARHHAGASASTLAHPLFARVPRPGPFGRRALLRRGDINPAYHRRRQSLSATRHTCVRDGPMHDNRFATAGGWFRNQEIAGGLVPLRGGSGYETPGKPVFAVCYLFEAKANRKTRPPVRPVESLEGAAELTDQKLRQGHPPARRPGTLCDGLDVDG